MGKDDTLWIGTAKGLFRADRSGGGWELAEPTLAGWECSALLPDGPDGAFLVGTSHYAYGPTVRRSDDGGANWSTHALREVLTESKHPINRIWQLATDPHQSGRVWAGIDEAALLHSDDGGATWAEVSTLTDHPSRPNWFPGAGGLCLHTIVHHPTDPQCMVVGISAVGVFRTTDGGATWHASNEGLPGMRETGAADEDAMYCIHKIAADPTSTDRLFMQFHAHAGSSGVFRSDDFGQNWSAIDDSFADKFGFPLVATDSGTVCVVPLQSDEQRMPTDGKLRVMRSTDGGTHWSVVDSGLPDSVYAGVLRDAMSATGESIAFGTTNGDVFVSDDAGANWGALPGRLPRVMCVRWG
ncbi:MAG: sialidase family protein [Planctomycetota bacterium]